jgi:hypothetical protein
MSSWGRVIVAIEPIGNLLVVPPLLTETAYPVVQELLVGGIWCYPEVCDADRQGKGKKDINSVILCGFLPPSKIIQR